MKFTALIPLFGLASSSAQLTYLETPQLKWSRTTSAARDMNGAFIHPSEDIVYALSSTGFVSAFPAGLTNEPPNTVWSPFLPNAISPPSSISCSSGITFCYGGNPNLNDYLVYTVVEQPSGQGEDAKTSRIIALDKETGEPIFESKPFPGIARTPKTTVDCRHVVVTSNVYNATSDRTDGYFLMFDLLSANDPTEPLFQDGPSLSIPYSDVG